MTSLVKRTFWEDFKLYTGRMSLFRHEDWKVYALWTGLIAALLGAVSGFLLLGLFQGVRYPAYVWNIPLGIFIFLVAIAIDTIGHRTVYQRALERGEALVHHITIAAGISSVVLLCLAYHCRAFFTVPALVLTGLSILYSVIDEAMHWVRYFQGHSDRIEMWSHFFIFVGHTIMMAAWCWWFVDGYPGVAETLRFWSA